MSEVPQNAEVKRFLKNANLMLKSVIVYAIFLGISIALLVAEITTRNTHFLILPNWFYFLIMFISSSIWFIYLLKKMEQDLPEYAAWHHQQKN